MTKILVIEDQQSLLEEILDMLRFENFEAIGAENGLVGVDLAREHLPDLIICDIMMPKLDGYGVLLELRSEPATATIPFVFLTAKTDRVDLRTGMELGADDYLTKPFSYEELLKAIYTRLEKRAQLQSLSEQKLEALRAQILLALPHELNTPLTWLLGYSEFLIENPTAFQSPDKIEELGYYVQKAALRLHHLIENYLMYVQIGFIRQDSAKIEMLRSEGAAVPRADIEKWVAVSAQRAGREADLKLDIADTAVVHIFADYLRKIVVELVDNAFKFSAPGTQVYVTATVDHNEYVLQISDQGRGMTPEQIADVGAYMQFDRKLYEQQGSGMGLIIAKQLTELHGGQFSIHSIPKQGTTVRVVLP